MPAMLPVTIWTIAAAALTGLLLALLGTLKLALARRPQRAASFSLLFILLNVALLPLLLLSGLLVDYVGLRAMMITGPVLLALSLLALSARPNYTRTVAAVLGTAAAATILATTSAALMPRALFGEQELVPSFLLGAAFVGLGALGSAPLVDLLLRGMGQRQTMAMLALVALTPAFLAALPEESVLKQVTWPGGIVDLMNEPAIWLGALVFFFYAPLEGFISVWTTKYLEHLGESGKATGMLMGFWTAVIMSRLAVALIQHSAGARDAWWADWIITIISLLIAVVLGNLAAMTGVGSIRVSLWLLGACMGPLVPLVIGLVFGKLVPGSEDGIVRVAMPGTAYALLCAGGSLGGLVLSPIIGFCARSKTLTVALLVPTFVALLLTGSAVVFALQPNR